MKSSVIRICALLALLAGCTVGPDFVRPEPVVPAQWSPRAGTPAPAPAPSPDATEGGAASATLMVPATWWYAFGDTTLDSLEQRALAQNLDLRTAVLRIEESRAQRDVTAAANWPTVALDAGYSRQRLSETTPTGALFTSVGSIRLPGGGGINVPNPYSQYQLAATASWEPDLFGRIRRAVEAADASLQATMEDRRGVQVALVADLAQGYLTLRNAQARLVVERESLATEEELLELTRQRRAAGLTTELDVSNAQAQSSLTRAQLPLVEQQITQDINQLSQLLGQAPEALRGELETMQPAPPVPPPMPLGVPAELARARPDIREAEATLHAAIAQIGVAVADLFPRLTLSAGGGFQSETTGQLLEWASRYGSIGPSLDVPVFDRSRWKTVRLYDLRAQEAALAYQRTVLNALHEVENAAAAYAADQERRQWLEDTVAQNRDVLTLARMRYSSGLANFIEVLDADRTLQQNLLSLLDTRNAMAVDRVTLYRALGGGWQAEAGR
jgi:NodT family efflux transporter outer membrane factor (OMF) lipoprotein